MNTNGVVTDTHTYDAYGSLIASNEATPNDFLYCGQRFDRYAGLYNNRARHYAPDLGIFTSRAGDYGNNEDTLLLHKYLYAADDPVNKMDPSGHDYGDFDINLGSIDNLLATIGPAVTSESGLGVYGGTGGPDVTKTLTSTLLDVQAKFYGWNPSQVNSAAEALTDYTGAYLYGGGAASAWDILDLYYLGAQIGPNALWGDNGSYCTCGSGAYKYTVAVNGKVCYASAVNYALFGQAYRLLHDYYDVHGQKHSDGTFEFSAEDFTLSAAKKVATAWKHWKYHDYGETSIEAEAFTAYGYNNFTSGDGDLTSIGLPCSPSGTLVRSKFDWCWEPNVPRPTSLSGH